MSAPIARCSIRRKTTAPYFIAGQKTHISHGPIRNRLVIMKKGLAQLVHQWAVHFH
ncbi:MAG: DUF3912 domain-containing protein [Rhizobiaceae bacterium]|nr:DUF3912 domain-containing protein [Rhizobiaceae bacterium]